MSPTLRLAPAPAARTLAARSRAAALRRPASASSTVRFATATVAFDGPRRGPSAAPTSCAGSRVPVPGTLVPGVVVGAVSLGCGSPLEAVVSVRIHATGAEIHVPAVNLVKQLAPCLAPGDAVLVTRAASEGSGSEVYEESATVVEVPTSSSAPWSGLPVLLASGAVATVDPACVRKADPHPGVASPSSSLASHQVKLAAPALLVPEFAQRFPELAPLGISPNPHAAPGRPLYDAFAAIVSDASTGGKTLDLLLHGTKTASNVDSILASGLHGGGRTPPQSWLTASPATARHYGGLHLVACLVLRDPGVAPTTSITNHAHHLPVLKVG